MITRTRKARRRPGLQMSGKWEKNERDSYRIFESKLANTNIPENREVCIVLLKKIPVDHFRSLKRQQKNLLLNHRPSPSQDPSIWMHLSNFVVVPTKRLIAQSCLKIFSFSPAIPLPPQDLYANSIRSARRFLPRSLCWQDFRGPSNTARDSREIPASRFQPPTSKCRLLARIPIVDLVTCRKASEV